jgi:hypothetical protein
MAQNHFLLRFGSDVGDAAGIEETRLLAKFNQQVAKAAGKPEAQFGENEYAFVIPDEFGMGWRVVDQRVPHFGETSYMSLEALLKELGLRMGIATQESSFSVKSSDRVTAGGIIIPSGMRVSGSTPEVR